MIEVYSTREKVYIGESSKGCIARFCALSAEFFEGPDSPKVFENCSFEKFLKEARQRGYAVKEKHRPSWAKK
jgi:hypothetical protein